METLEFVRAGLDCEVLKSCHDEDKDRIIFLRRDGLVGTLGIGDHKVRERTARSSGRSDASHHWDAIPTP